jgi:hypothetical protein
MAQYQIKALTQVLLLSTIGLHAREQGLDLYQVYMLETGHKKLHWIGWNNVIS